MSRGKSKKKDQTVLVLFALYISLNTVMYHRNIVRRSKKNIIIPVSLSTQDFVMVMYIIVIVG